MPLQRLTFLYPHLYKTIRGHESSQSIRSLPSRKKRLRRSTFSTIPERRQDTYPQRYGNAAEPLLPPPPIPDDLEKPKTLASAIEKEVKGPRSKQEEKQQEQSDAKEPKKPNQEAKPPIEKSAEPKSSPLENPSQSNQLNASQSRPNENNLTVSREGMIKPVEAILKMGPPNDVQPQEHKPPHLHAPPYVHHFDTFTLVRDLQNGGFSEAQSITLMKAVRSLLAVNMDIAREGLISKSDVENVSPSQPLIQSPHPPIPSSTNPSPSRKTQETYLFRAACSELRTEILNARKISTNKMATHRTHLQHEVDILSQKASQEALALKDDLRGMLNDRQMTVRMEHQARDSDIQELNYKITVALNSDSKSEVEGLRWVLTRRAAMAIASMARKFLLFFKRRPIYITPLSPTTKTQSLRHLLLSQTPPP